MTVGRHQRSTLPSQMQSANWRDHADVSLMSWHHCLFLPGRFYFASKVFPKTITHLSRKMATITVLETCAVPWCPSLSFNDCVQREEPPVEGICDPKAIRQDFHEIHGISPGDDARNGSANASRLLSLPLELRQAIYRWVHLMTPMRHAQLAPWYPVPVPREYIMRPVVVEEEQSSQEPSAEVAQVEEPSFRRNQLLSSKRPWSGIPTSLLQTNRQIYYEARQVPFLYNEFVFVNWFSSGIWAARALTRQLQAWQLESFQQARIEVLTQDLTGQGAREFANVCSSLAEGLRGLRLTIAAGGGKMGLGWLHDAEVSWEDGQSGGGIGWDWAEAGLSQLKALERLEVELDVPRCDKRQQLDWCETLQEKLRRKGLTASVICVARFRSEAADPGVCDDCR